MCAKIPAGVCTGKVKDMKKKIIKQIVVALMLVGVIVLVSCGFKGCDTEEPVDVQVYKALDDVVSSAIESDENPDQLLTATESRNGYEVLSYTETETGVLVTFLVYAPDLYTVAKEIDENYQFETEEELKSAVIDAVGKAQIVEQEITMEFRKTDDGYEPILTMEFIDAYYGGVIKLLDEALSKLDEEEAQ